MATAALNDDQHRSMVVDHAEPAGREPYMHSVLYVKGFFLFQRWRRLNVELKNSVLTLSVLKGGVVKRTFQLDSRTICEDSSLRHFCFSIYKPTGERIYLAADNMAAKESWTEAIQGSLSIQRLAGRKLKVDDHARVMNQYINRPVMYIKVIRAKNLLPKDVNGTSDPYVKITVGASTVRTTTRKKDLNPEWGMVFSFDWDLSMRYALVEVYDEDYSSTDDFLGQVIVPMLPLRYSSEEPVAQWFPLTRRSSRSEFRGALQLEISVSSTAMIPESVVLYDFVKEVTNMEEFAMNILPSEDGWGVIPLKQNGKLILGNIVIPSGEEEKEFSAEKHLTPQEKNLHKLLYSQRIFPNSFPSLQCEQIEDIAFHVILSQSLSGRKMTCPGVLLFTNYRLLFVTHARIFSTASDLPSSTPNPDAYPFDEDVAVPSVDLSTQVFVGQVVSIHLTSEHDSGNYYESLKIRTTDHRQLLFMFKDDSVNINDNNYFQNYMSKFNKRMSTFLGTMSSKRGVLKEGSQKLLAAGNTIANTILGAGSVADDNSVSDAMSIESNTSQRKMSILSYTSSITGVGGGPSSTSALPSGFPNSANNSSVSPSPAAASLLGINLDDEKLTGLTSSWIKMLISPSVSLIEALDSVEGPPAHRIYYRLKNRCSNRPIERYLGSVQHHKLLNQLREECGLMSYPLPEYVDEKPPLPFYEVDDGVDGNDGAAVSSNETRVDPPSAIVAPQNTSISSPVVTKKGRAHSEDFAMHMNPMSPANKSSQSLQSSTHLVRSLKDGEATELLTARAQAVRAEFQQNNTPKALTTRPSHGEESRHSATELVIRSNSNVSPDSLEQPSPDHFTTSDVESSTPLLPATLTSSEVILPTLLVATTYHSPLREFLIKFFFNVEAAWHIYDPLVEFRRLQIPNKQWRLTALNSAYQLCPTYPDTLCVPASTTDEDLVLASKFRSKGRLPALSWLSPKGVPICRCSQPMVGISNHRNIYDEQLVNEIRRSAIVALRNNGVSLTTGSSAAAIVNPTPNTSSRRPPPSTADDQSPHPLVVIDARPLLNAKANQAVGKGVESERNYTNIQILFMDIPNIHAVRKAYDMLEDCIYSDEQTYVKNVENTLWLAFIRKILQGVMKIVYLVNKLHVPILIHCSDGWDRTAQLASLSMLLSDGYYRTIRGFIVLIEKEWCAFGHKFADRLGYTYENYKDEERSPIFIQFLDAVYQVLSQYPNVFEFTSTLLLFLQKHLYSALFGTFLFNNEYEKKYFNIENHSFSIWTVVLANISQFLNPNYHSVDGYLIPIISRTKLNIWQEKYFHWHDKLFLYQFQNFNELTVTNNSTMANINQLLYGASNQFSGNNKPVVWVEDKHATTCMKCDRAFNMWRRRHHCRCCGLIYCDRCCRELRLIPAISTWKLSRCCLDCAQALDLALIEAELSQKKLSTSFRRSMEVIPAQQQYRQSVRKSQALSRMNSSSRDV